MRRKSTYQQYVIGTLSRFDHKNTMFSRACWEKENMAKKQTQNTIAQAKMKKGLPGFTQADFALKSGSWHIAHTYGMSGRSIGNSGLYNWNSQDSESKSFFSDRKVELNPAEASKKVKHAAKLFGADLVGTCKLNHSWLYSKIYEHETGKSIDVDSLISDNFGYAIALAIEMDYEVIKTSPTALGDATVGVGYSYMPVVASMVAKYIRGLGYKAIPMGNDTALSVPIAVDAGLGELGRNGLLITPQFGPRIRLCKVITDLPLEPDDPIDLGVQKFCEDCKKCSKECPSKAITSGERMEWADEISSGRGLMKWPIDPKKCYNFWLSNGVPCGNCITSCPFNKPNTSIHSLAKWSTKNLPFFNKFLIWLDDVMGYGTNLNPDDYWKDRL